MNRRSGKRGTGISMLAAQHDDDIYVYIYIYICVCVCVCVYIIYIYIVIHRQICFILSELITCG